MIVVAIIGILASVAIPVFVRYMAKSRTTEADVTLKDLWNRVRAYRFKEHANPAGMGVLPTQFPESAPLAPGATCCSMGGKCPPSAAYWTHPTWEAMAFQIEKAHYYRYEIVTANGSSPQTFSVFAFGDLDCDGLESTFQVTGIVEGDDVLGSGTPHRVRDLE